MRHSASLSHYLRGANRMLLKRFHKSIILLLISLNTFLLAEEVPAAQPEKLSIPVVDEYEEVNLGQSAWDNSINTPIVGFDRVDGGLNPQRFRVKGQPTKANNGAINGKNYTAIIWERSYRLAKRIIDSNSAASDYFKTTISKIEEALCDGNNQVKSYLVIYRSSRFMQLINAGLAYSADKYEKTTTNEPYKNCLYKRMDYDLRAAQFSVSGTGYSGTAENRWLEVMEPASAGKRFLWHLSDISMVIGKGSHEGSFTGFESVLADAIPIGNFKIVAGLNVSQVPKYRGGESSREGKLYNAFGGNVLELPEPDAEVLKALANHYIQEFKISENPMNDEEFKYVYENSKDKLMNIPYVEDAVFNVIDRLAQFKAKDPQLNIFNFNTLAKSIGEVGNFPEWILNEDQVLTKINELRNEITKVMVGQKHLVSEVITKVQSYFIAGRTNPKPAASMLFLGPTGTGKTFLAQLLSEVLYGQKPTTIYLTNYNSGSKEKFVETVAEQLLKNSYQVMVFEEIDKAPDEIRNVLYPLLDEGIFYDTQQRPISARGLIAIATTNAGADLILKKAPTDLGEITDEHILATKYAAFRDEIISTIGQSEINSEMGSSNGGFRASFDIRFNTKAVFLPFSDSEKIQLAKIILKKAQKILSNRKWTFKVETSVPEWIAASLIDNSKGARPIDYMVEDILTQGAAAYSIVTKQVINDNLAKTFTLKKHPTKSGAFIISESQDPKTEVEYLLNTDSRKVITTSSGN